MAFSFATSFLGAKVAAPPASASTAVTPVFCAAKFDDKNVTSRRGLLSGIAGLAAALASKPALAYSTRARQALQDRPERRDESRASASASASSSSASESAEAPAAAEAAAPRARASAAAAPRDTSSASGLAAKYAARKRVRSN
eukprot:tig00000670_g3043.t1